MALFLILLNRLIPLYLLVFAGFVTGKKLELRKEPIAVLLIYFLTPMVVFTGVMNAELALNRLALPILFYVLCCSIALIFLHLGGRIWTGSTKNLLGFTAGNANTGYFGIPVAMALLGTDSLSLVVLCAFGFIFYENTLGFFISARGNHSVREALDRVIRLPAIYAFALGVVANLTHVHFSGVYGDLLVSIRGAYSVLGMMMIGLGVSTIEEIKIDWKFLGISFLAKFVFWPVVVGLIIAADLRFLHFFTHQIHQVMIIMAIVPLAANTVAIAALLKTEPEKAATAVLLSTVFALVFIPLVALFLHLQ